MYQIEIIDEFPKWRELSTSWNKLLEQSDSNTIFLTWEWLYTWAEHFLGSNRKLFILAVYEKEKLIGLAPWCIRGISKALFQLRQIEFLGSPEMGSDYLDVFARRGKEKEVALHIYRFLFGESTNVWGSLLLRDIPADSLFLLHFLEAARQHGRYLNISEGAFCPFVILPRSWEEFMRSLSSNRREKFRRHYRLLQRQGDVHHSTLIQDEKSLARFNSLYRSWWGKDQDDLFYDHLEKFASRTVSRSWNQIDFLSVDGKDIAAFWHLRYQGNLLMYLMAVDKDFNKKISIGTILMGLCLEKAIADGINLYDFLKGNEDFKFHWASNGRRSLVLQMYQRRLSALGVVLANMLKGIARILIR